MIVQEAIYGIPLWNMVGLGATVKDEYRQHLPYIASQIMPLQSPNMRCLFDWNPKNFIYVISTKKLWYIDNKPTLFPTKSQNDWNLRLFRESFLGIRWPESIVDCAEPPE